MMLVEKRLLSALVNLAVTFPAQADDHPPDVIDLAAIVAHADG